LANNLHNTKKCSLYTNFNKFLIEFKDPNEAKIEKKVDFNSLEAAFFADDT